MIRFPRRTARSALFSMAAFVARTAGVTAQETTSTHDELDLELRNFPHRLAKSRRCGVAPVETWPISLVSDSFWRLNLA